MKTETPKTFIDILKQEIKWAIEDKKKQKKLISFFNNGTTDSYVKLIKLNSEIDALYSVIDEHMRDAQARFDMEQQKKTKLGKLGITVAKY